KGRAIAFCRFFLLSPQRKLGPRNTLLRRDGGPWSWAPAFAGAAKKELKVICDSPARKGRGDEQRGLWARAPLFVPPPLAGGGRGRGRSCDRTRRCDTVGGTRKTGR